MAGMGRAAAEHAGTRQDGEEGQQKEAERGSEGCARTDGGTGAAKRRGARERMGEQEGSSTRTTRRRAAATAGHMARMVVVIARPEISSAC